MKQLTKTKPTSRIWLNPHGIIEQIYIGKQSEASVNLSVTKTRQLMAQLYRASKPVLILVDLSQIMNSDLTSRMAAAKALTDNPYHKIALYGADTFNSMVTKLLIATTGKGRKVKLFENRAAALDWLKS